MAELPTGTVTFLFTDIEGSTRLLQDLGSGYTELLEQHREILRTALAAHAGVEFGTEGDAHFVSFPSATDAARAAVEAQRALAAHPWPGNGRIRVRMGLHTGEGRVSGSDYVGIDVHRAARIAAAGHGGQVLLSAATAELVGGELPDGVRLLDLGHHRLKDLEQSERLSQLVIPGLRADFPPLRSMDARPNNLPAELTSFVGREAELVSIMELLQANRLVTLTGPGGTGKTRLALHAASQVLHRFQDGVFLVPLATVGDPSLVSSTVAQALGVQEMGDRPVLDLVKQHLEDREMLLVLDNFEQILPAAPLVTDLLQAAHGLKMLVTSQAVLHVAGEQEFPLDPLALPDPKNLPELSALSQYDAVALFIQRARAVNPTFSVTNQNAPAVAEICARLDGLPLAIELAAARTKLLAPEALLRRLQQGLTILKAGTRELPARQQTLRAAIAWSYDLLEPEEQAVFRRLGAFLGGWTVEAAEAVVPRDGDAPADVLDTMEALANRSLLRLEPDAGGEPRFWMLMTIREFALEQLTASGERDAVARAHAARFLELAEAAEPNLMGADRAEWLDRLEREHDNVGTALRFSIDAGDANTALRMSGALWRFWQFRGHLNEGRTWLAEALAMPGATEKKGALAKALQGMAGLAYWQRDYQAASGAYEEALALCREVGEPADIATALYNLAFSLGAQWETERPRVLLAESHALYQQVGDRGGAAYTGLLLAGIEQLDGRWNVARSVIEGTLATFRELGDRWGLANVLGLAATVDRELGDTDSARVRLAEALQLFSEGGDVAATAMELGALAAVAVAVGDGEAAATFAGAWRALEDKVGGGAPDALRGFDDPVPPARGLLGDEAFASAWERGRALALDEAVREALDWAAAGSTTPAAGK